jgi:hypothetical protein
MDPDPLRHSYDARALEPVRAGIDDASFELSAQAPLIGCRCEGGPVISALRLEVGRGGVA